MEFFPTVPLLLLSPLVLVHIGLQLAARGDTGPAMPQLEQLARIAPFVAVSAALSYVPGPGRAAALISVPWLAFTVAVAAAGLARTLSRRTLAHPGIGVDAGLMFLVVGGAWLTISRAGWNPMGFSDAIVQLTAVHFHYAGFALPIVAGCVASRLERSALVPAAIIVGVPLTAIGITAGGWLEWFAATIMAFAGLATAVLVLKLGMQIATPTRWALAMAGLALTAGMTLALWWAWSVRFDWTYLGLEDMAATHGALNALGFGLIGLFALRTLPPSKSTGELIALHVGTPGDDELQRLTELAREQEPTNAVGLLNRPLPVGFSHRVWTHPIEHGDMQLARQAIQNWRGHGGARIRTWPERPAIAVGETLGIVIPVGPICVSGASRIVDVVDEVARYGFTYSTMPHHPVDGEESFIVSRTETGDLQIVVTAVWRRSILANVLFPPMTRFLQDRAINQYLRGIAAAEA